MKQFQLIGLLCLLCCAIHAQDSLRIRLISDQSPPGSERDPFEASVRQEIRQLLDARVDLRITSRYSDNRVDRVKTELRDAYASNRVDVVVLLGLTPSAIALRQDSFPKPTIPSIVIEPMLRGLALDTTTDQSGIRNMVYVESPFDIERDMRALRRLLPVEQLGLLQLPSSNGLARSFAEIAFASQQVQLRDIAIRRADTGLQLAIPDSIDAVYIVPVITELSDTELSTILDSLHQRGIATMGLLGELFIEQGGLLAYEAADNLNRIAKRIALNLLKISEGQATATLPVRMPTFSSNLLINMRTARATGIYPDWDLVRSAILVNLNATPEAASLSLKTAITEALENNLELLAARRDPQIAERDQGLARSDLLPQLSANTALQAVDEITAEGSFGAQGRYNWIASGNLSQVVFSEPALANVVIQGLLQQGQEAATRQVQLNIIQDVSSAYLQILLAEQAVRIQNENVELTRDNLNIAQAKERVGYTGATDINRWKSEVALANIDLNDAQARLRQARYQLNQLLNRPQGETLDLENIDPDQNALQVADDRVQDLINNEGQLERFATFLTVEARNNLPELQEIDYNLAAQRRRERSRERAYYLPSLQLSGQGNYIIERYDVTTPEVPFEFPIPDGQPTWTLTLGLQYNILQGGRRNLELQKTRLQIDQLEYQRQDLSNQLELRLRSRVQDLAASYFELRLSRDAADAAEDNYEIILDSYSQGLTNVTALIDAQNARVNTQVQSETAFYQYLIDFLALERAVGYYNFLRTPQQRQAFYDRLSNFLLRRR